MKITNYSTKNYDDFGISNSSTGVITFHVAGMCKVRISQCAKGG